MDWMQNRVMFDPDSKLHCEWGARKGSGEGEQSEPNLLIEIV